MKDLISDLKNVYTISLNLCSFSFSCIQFMLALLTNATSSLGRRCALISHSTGHLMDPRKRSKIPAPLYADRNSIPPHARVVTAEANGKVNLQ